MKHDIIKTDDYLLVVDESEIKAGEFYLLIPELVVKMSRSGLPSMAREWKKIIAHLPLNGSPILKGVDLLPPLEEDSIGWPLIHYINEKHNQDRVMGFCDGYNKAKEKYKYTEEDLLRLLCWADSDERNVQGQKFEDFIQSLSQPKIPIGFEFETSPMNIDEIREQGKGFLNANTNKIKTTATPEGHTQWEGTYIY